MEGSLQMLRCILPEEHKKKIDNVYVDGKIQLANAEKLFVALEESLGEEIDDVVDDLVGAAEVILRIDMKNISEYINYISSLMDGAKYDIDCRNGSNFAESIMNCDFLDKLYSAKENQKISQMLSINVYRFCTKQTTIAMKFGFDQIIQEMQKFESGDEDFDLSDSDDEL